MEMPMTILSYTDDVSHSFVSTHDVDPVFEQDCESRIDATNDADNFRRNSISMTISETCPRNRQSPGLWTRSTKAAH